MNRRLTGGPRSARTTTGGSSEENRRASRTAPPSVHWRDPRFPWLVPALLLIVTRGFMALAIPWASEDAYITFRYAANLANGLGPVFNPGEHVMGFTSPLWTLWVAFGVWLHVDPVPWTQISGVAADLATLWLAVPVITALVSRMAGWSFALFFAIWPVFAVSAVSGLEVSLMLFLIVASAVLVERRSVSAGVVLGALSCVRPEGMIAALVIGLRAARRAQLTAVACVAAMGVWLWLEFHSLVPQSIAAKAIIYGTPGPWAGRHWWDWLVPFPMGRYPTSSEGLALMPFALVFGAALIAGVRRLTAARRSATAAVGAAGLVIWLCYCATGVAYFWWYMTVPLAALAWTAAAGLGDVVRGRLIPALLVLALAGAWVQALPLYLGRAQTEYRNFMSVHDFLAPRVGRSDSVLLEPIGMIGWRLPARLIDEVGLVTPDVTRMRRSGPGWYADIVNAQRPRWIVARPEMFAEGQAFAGTGAPFRDRGELMNLRAHYEQRWPESQLPGIGLVVLERLP